MVFRGNFEFHAFCFEVSSNSHLLSTAALQTEKAQRLSPFLTENSKLDAL